MEQVSATVELTVCDMLAGGVWRLSHAVPGGPQRQAAGRAEGVAAGAGRGGGGQARRQARYARRAGSIGRSITQSWP